MRVKRIAMLVMAFGLTLSGTAPAPAHTQTKADPDDSDSFLDIEESAFWHEDGRWYFLVKTYDKWDLSDFDFDHGFDVHMDTRGTEFQDYSIFVQIKEGSVPSAAGAEEETVEVIARLGDWSVEEYLGQVKMQRPTQRKTLFSFKRDRIKVRSGYMRWNVETSESPPMKAMGAEEDPCSEGCSDRAPDLPTDPETAPKWYRHNF